MTAYSPLEEFLEREVKGWKDDTRATALFKAFAGQRQDYEGRLEFWKSLIVKAARHLDIIIIDAEEVQNCWFLRQGLSPLCLKDVLTDMVNSGELLRMECLLAGRQSSLSWAFSRVRSSLTWLGLHLLTTPSYTETTFVEGTFVVTTLLKERLAQVIRSLSQASWSSSCITTMEKFVNLCGGEREAKASLSYLLSQRRAQPFVIPGENQIQGLKISLVQGPVGNVSEIDYHMLQLLSTRETLDERLDFFDKRILHCRESAAVAVKRGNKHIALRHLRCMKILSGSRDKCANFSQKIEEVLAIISDAETTKKVSEALELGNRAIQDHQVTIEDVHVHLEQLEQSVLLQRDMEDAIGSASLAIAEIDDFKIEEEFAMLEAELQEAPTTKNENFSAEKDTMLPTHSTLPATISSAKHRQSANHENNDLAINFANLVLEPA